MRFPPLYAILDEDQAARAGWSLVDLAAAFLAGGARFLQLRAKHASSAWLLDTSTAVVRLAREAGALLLVNDRADVARLAGADGVHLGQDDLPAAAARTIVGPAAIVGVSTHTLAQIDAALDAPISYLAIGPVFGTGTKDTGYDPVGLDGVRRAAARARARHVPVIAIGGISLERAAEVLDAGASSVAVISDLLAGGGPERRVRAYVERLKV